MTSLVSDPKYYWVRWKSRYVAKPPCEDRARLEVIYFDFSRHHHLIHSYSPNSVTVDLPST